jgi:hypothetical protein
MISIVADYHYDSHVIEDEKASASVELALRWNPPELPKAKNSRSKIVKTNYDQNWSVEEDVSWIAHPVMNATLGNTLKNGTGIENN